MKSTEGNKKDKLLFHKLSLFVIEFKSREQKLKNRWIS